MNYRKYLLSSVARMPEGVAGGEVEQIVPGSHEAVAIHLAEALAADDDFNQHVREAAEADETIKRTVLVLWADMLSVYPDGLGEFPEPGSDKGNNPDIYKDGKKRGSFYNDFCSALPFGSECDTALAGLAKAKEGDATSPFASIIGMAGEIDKLTKMWTQRRSTFRTRVKNVVRLDRQIDSIHALIPDTEVVWTETTMGKDPKTGKPVGVQTLASGMTPLTVQHKTDRKLFENMNVTDFLSMKPAVAVQNGANYLALVKTKGRAGSAGGDGDGEGVLTPKKTEDAIAKLAHAVGEDTVIAYLLKRVNSRNPEDSDDLVESLHIIKTELAPIWAATEVRNQNILIARQIALGEAGKAALAAKTKAA